MGASDGFRKLNYGAIRCEGECRKGEFGHCIFSQPNLKTMTGNKPIIIPTGTGINQTPSVIP
jgi:hypothetical protein